MLELAAVDEFAAIVEQRVDEERSELRASERSRRQLGSHALLLGIEEECFPYVFGEELFGGHKKEGMRESRSISGIALSLEPNRVEVHAPPSSRLRDRGVGSKQGYSLREQIERTDLRSEVFDFESVSRFDAQVGQQLVVVLEHDFLVDRRDPLAVHIELHYTL